jgi:hypothetical protein
VVRPVVYLGDVDYVIAIKLIIRFVDRCKSRK